MNHSISQEKQSKSEWFKLVVENVIYFFSTSIDNVQRDPKSSIIDMYTAIELLFKARLMNEHWSLIIEKPELADFKKFELGDFKSVSFIQAHKRLNQICGEEFNMSAIENFTKLGMHRNQIVHFAHTNFKNDKVDVVIELWASWFYVYELVNEQWSEFFKEFKHKFTLIDTNVQKYKPYLEGVLKIKEKDISIQLKKGNTITNCPSCSLESALILKDEPIVDAMVWRSQFEWGPSTVPTKKYTCLVCKTQGYHTIAK